MGPANNIGYLLQHLSSVLAKQSDQLLQDKLGIGFSQFKLLMVLERKPYIKQNEIAAKLGQTEASISRQIKLMHERGLLQTTINPQSKRDRLTTPTARGLELSEQALGVLNLHHGPMFERLSEQQRQQLLSAMQTLHQFACQKGRLGACDHPFES